ncbi:MULTISPECIES: hypothetical protein [Streptomycetaceae]|uniref:hypothetical protein n=1 Tax=Streptomycetaceae TaxID=2062 RepID=UPI000B0D1F51|nr:hypothetical protein [Streptomyces sp. NRRL S-350]
MSKSTTNIALDALRYLAWMAAAGLFIYDQTAPMWVAIVVAVGLGEWLSNH